MSKNASRTADKEQLRLLDIRRELVALGYKPSTLVEPGTLFLMGLPLSDLEVRVKADASKWLLTVH